MIGCIIYLEIIQLDDAKAEKNHFQQKFTDTAKAGRLVAGVGLQFGVGGFLHPKYYFSPANGRG
jgi:hypothetical protein